VVVGCGNHPSGKQEAWIASLDTTVIPEPISMAFMGSAFVGVICWRVRKRRREAKKEA